MMDRMRMREGGEWSTGEIKISSSSSSCTGRSRLTLIIMADTSFLKMGPKPYLLPH